MKIKPTTLLIMILAAALLAGTVVFLNSKKQNDEAGTENDAGQDIYSNDNGEKSEPTPDGTTKGDQPSESQPEKNNPPDYYRY